MLASSWKVIETIMAKSLIETANEYVSISVVFNWLKIDVPESQSGTTFKVHCPFEEFYHIDQGRQKSLRVYYSTNSAFCFAGCGYMTPVSLFSQKTGLTNVESASFLLSKQGYDLPSLEQDMIILANQPTTINYSSLRQALQFYCSRIFVGWNTLQFEDFVLDAMSHCLELLDKVETETDANEWLNQSKTYLKEVVNSNVKI